MDDGRAERLHAAGRRGMRVRCFIPPEQWEREPLLISGEEAHHLARVLRAAPGMGITCFDGRGHEAQAEVARVGRREILLEVKERATVPAPLFPITLGMALPKHEKLDPIINHATQLGVARIVPLLTARTVVRMSAEEFERKRSRWTQIAVQAGKQSGSSYLPEIGPLTRWKDLVRSFREGDLILLGAVEGPHEDLSALLSGGNPGSVLLLIGPEGDFTPAEAEEAVRAGAHRISLGPTVLRCETAAVVALGLVGFFLHRRQQRS